MSEDLTFADLGLDPRILAALDSLGFERPTPIQAEAIAPLLEGRDVVARARTGSGKTAAFGLPLLQRIQDGGKGPRALVLAPTRELAVQVTEAIESFATQLNTAAVTIYGGASYRPQLIALKRGVPVVVGTPGRLIDHLEKGSLDLSNIDIVAIDEADEMLRMGFIDAVEQILEATPEGRQVALFSATMPPAIRRVADRFLSDPVTVEADMERGTTTDHVQQRVVVVPRRFKPDALVRYLRGEERGATLVFSRTKLGCAEIAAGLTQRGIPADALHGDLAQRERERVIGRLRSSNVDVVVATDVAARGIDIEHITHVVNYDLPDSAESYTHRIGRTGRAGREGTALTLITPQERGRLRFFARTLNADLQEQQLPTDAALGQKARAGLVAELGEAGDDAKEWLAHLIEEGTSVEDIAAAALELLARNRNVPLSRDLPDELPQWARPRAPREHRENRHDGPRHDGPRHDGPRYDGPRNDGPRNDGPRNDGPRNDRSRGPTGPENEVELFVGAGRAMGVRPGDLVGALAGDAGISGREVGRIQVGERSSFVGVSRATAAKVLNGRTSLEIRGRTVKLALARPGGGPGGGGPGPQRSWQQRGPGGPGGPPNHGPRPNKGPWRPNKKGPGARPSGPKGGSKPWKGSGGKR